MACFIIDTSLLLCFTPLKPSSILCNPHNKKIAVLGQKYDENVKNVFNMSMNFLEFSGFFHKARSFAMISPN